MTTIPLDRRFYEWRGDERSHLRTRFRPVIGLSDGLLRWQDLLARRRVVVLAEAGSGKTEEMKEQTRQQTIAGKFAIYATVQDVGRDGLENSLRATDRARLNVWRNGREPGWFFFDSIDEAKLDNIRLERALRQIANGISGAEGRAHIVLSGRHTDWEFARDARRLDEELPLPPDVTPATIPSLEDLIRGLLRDEKRADPAPAEEPLIAVMAPLDEDKVRTYAAAKNACQVEGLMRAIELANLWEFARRPLDLDWIVRYWHAHGRLDKFASMVEASLRERMREADPDRARQDSLGLERAQRGLERVGAALVFGRQSSIAIPDKDVIVDTRTAITLDDVFPDWSSEDRGLLLTRPVFDPATFGRARLHNDNEGVVRAYLAAAWLRHLRQINLPRRRLHDLLFSHTYEIEVIKPSMLETAAWLSLWDDGVATEVIKRAPFLLFTAGDPASLPPLTRQKALFALVERMRRDEEVPLLDLSSQTRFAQPDIAPALREIWEADQEDRNIRRFVLRLIWLGRLNECADIAVAASFGHYPDLYTAIVAGRALLAAGNEEQHKRYAEYIKQNCASISPTVVSEALEELFPNQIGVDDLLKILEVVTLGDAEGGGFNMKWNGPELAAKLVKPTELTGLIDGMLRQLESEPRTPDSDDNSARRIQYAATLMAAAEKLLDQAPDNIAPQAAIDAVLSVGYRHFQHTQWLPQKGRNAAQQLQQTKERRQATFWRAATQLSKHAFERGATPLSIFQMELFGWPSGLLLEDVEWLLADGRVREHASERRLATNAVLNIWSTQGKQDQEIRSKIEVAVAGNDDMLAVYNDWMSPPAMTPEEIKMEEENAEYRRAGENERSEREQSWFDFIAEIRANPAQLHELVPTTSESIDARIYDLWALLRQATGGSSRYAISSVAPIAAIIGDEAAAAFSAGLSAIWRKWTPCLRSMRPPEERNQISGIDCMCIAGVSIEAASDPDWAARLTKEQSVRAMEYATLELNGFPNWVESLAQARPEAIAQVLSSEVLGDLNNQLSGAHYQTLEDLRRGPEVLARLISPALWRELKVRPSLNQHLLRLVLPILVNGLPETDKPALYALVIDRVHDNDDVQICAQYLTAAYSIEASGATDALTAKLGRLNDLDKTALIEWTLPQIFGSRRSGPNELCVSLDLPTLERLVHLAYRFVPIEDDRDRANKGVYSPDQRDAAEEARSAAFTRLTSTPGFSAFAALVRLKEISWFPIPASRLEALARERAAQDSEQVAWIASDAFQFELQFERSPLTAKELQHTAMQRLEDLQYDLIHGDFQQGTTLSALPNEPAVQNWLADRLRHVQGQAYSIEREPHVAEEKEPDLRFRAKASDASVATEIKVAESWTLPELEAALDNQLCGQYLRAQDGREGILLLVHQRQRVRGWELPDGTFVNFEEIVRRLQKLAFDIRTASLTGAQPVVAVVDVSSCAQAAERSPKSGTGHRGSKRKSAR